MCDCTGSSSADKEAAKNLRWSVGRIRRPFLETLKKTECRKESWICCGRSSAECEEAEGRYTKCDAVTPKEGESELIQDASQRTRRKSDRTRWRGLVALLAACLFSICGSCIMWTTDAFDTFVANQMILDQNKGSFAWWVTPPINPWFKVYIWNYTNWEQYSKNPSIKIKLQEVGPFTYKEVIRRENIKFSEDGSLLTYTEAKSYEFLPELSGADLNSKVVVPNLPFFGAKAKMVQFPSIFGAPMTMAMQIFQLNEPFVTLPANDFIWGYDDNLFQLSKLAANVPMDRVGLLTAKKIPEQMTILTGASDIDRLSYFVSFNRKKMLDAWTDPACNLIDGSDGSMFPPRKVREKAQLYAFKGEACRVIEFVYNGTTKAQGVDAYRYIIERNTFNSPRSHSPNLCYCNKTDLRECAPDGLFDTSPCSYGAPTLISYPHFYLVDPVAREPFEGMHPDAEQHDMFADIHPRLGMTLQGRSRLQLNVRVVKEQRGLPKGRILPVAWFAQDLPSYEDGFKTFLIFATYSLDIIEFVLLYILPVVAIITALVIVRRLLRLRRAEEQPGMLVLHLTTTTKTRAEQPGAPAAREGPSSAPPLYPQLPPRD